MDLKINYNNYKILSKQQKEEYVFSSIKFIILLSIFVGNLLMFMCTSFFLVFMLLNFEISVLLSILLLIFIMYIGVNTIVIMFKSCVEHKKILRLLK